MKKLTINVYVTDNKKDYNSIIDSSENLRDAVQINTIFVENFHDSYDVYQEALSRVDSEYVAFWTDMDDITASAVETLVENLNGDEIYKIRMKKSGADWKVWPVIYFCYSAYIIRAELLKGLDVPRMSARCFREYTILELLKKGLNIKELENCILETSEVLENDKNIYEHCRDTAWYLEDLENFMLPYLQENGADNIEIQRRIYAAIVMRFYMNMSEKNKMAIMDEQIDQFLALVQKMLPYIDDKVIAQRDQHRGMPSSFTYQMFSGKHGEKLDYQIRKCRSSIKRIVHYDYLLNGYSLKSDLMKVTIFAINFANKKLTFDCELSADYFVNDPTQNLHVMVDGKRIAHDTLHCYNQVTCFGRAIFRPYQMSFSIALEDVHPGMKIEFYVMTKGGQEIRIPISYSRVASRLSSAYGNHYEFDQYMMIAKEQKIVIHKTSVAEHAWREFLLLLYSFAHPTELKRKFYYPYLRIMYWMSKKKYAEKDVWIFFDKLYKAGDNAEYLFDYCTKNASNADCYYIITKDSADYKRLKKKYKDHILVFGSKEQRIVTMNAKIIFATHVKVWGYCAFKGQMETCFRDLLRAEIVCIQHGLTVQSIAQYQNRLFDNTRLYFCASKYEIGNLMQTDYNYDKEQLILSGCPRYDGLKSNDKKYILIAPTWRSNIVINGNAIGTVKARNPEFKNTEYYKIYNNLIHNEKLLATAEKCGYRIVFLLHPTLSSQVDDFEGGKNVEILAAAAGVSYEKLMTEASLMLTDYSGIQFDFAYMKKPILYYHPEELPPQYEDSVYKYETMAFGPLITKAGDIVDALCESMRNGCHMEDIYKDRVDDFFAHTDYDNCRRILDVIMNREQ